MIAHNLGLPHAASGAFRRASECFRILTNRKNTRLGPEEGAAYLNLARIATLQGRCARASTLLGQAREIARKWRLQGLLADVLEAEGNLCRQRGDLEAAGERYSQARAVLTDLGRPDLLDNLAEEEAILAARRGNHGEAAAFFQSTGREFNECMARLWLALDRHLERDRHRAVTQALRALEIASRHDYRAPILRVAALDRAFHDLLASLAVAPAFLRQTPVVGATLDAAAAGEATRPGGTDGARRVRRERARPHDVGAASHSAAPRAGRT